MKVRFLTPAQRELDDAVAWYDEQAAGLGLEFLDEFDRAVRRRPLISRCHFLRSNEISAAADWHDSLTD